jgi:hypothetical protein
LNSLSFKFDEFQTVFYIDVVDLHVNSSNLPLVDDGIVTLNWHLSIVHFGVDVSPARNVA